MRLQSFYKKSVAHRNYTVELIAFVPFMLMIGTGLIMLKFHINEIENQTIWGIGKTSWLLFHKICSLLALCLVVWHLIQHADWIKKRVTFKLKNKFKRLNTALFIVFTLTVFTALLSWLFFQNTNIGEGLRGLHSKLGFLVMILFFFHLKNYFQWIKKMTVKLLNFK